ASINLEFQALKDELTRIANVTEYNGMNVLNGTYQTAGGVSKVDLSSAVGIWLFDEGTGSETKDLSGNGNHATLVKNPKWVTGRFGKALEFNGKDTYVKTGEKLLDAREEFTIVTWVKPEKITANRVGLVGQNDSPEFGFDNPNTLWLWTPAGDVRAQWKHGQPSEDWHHVAGVASKKDMRIYIDGEVVKSNGGGPFGSSPFNVNIGGGGVFDPGGNWFTGAMDEVAIFHKALNDEDVKEIMSGFASIATGGADGTAEGSETWDGSGPESLFNAVNDDGYVGDQRPGIYNQVQPGTSASSDPHGPPDNIRGHWRGQIGADNDINSQHEFSLTNATANGLDLEDDNVLSVDEARTAITAIDHAIDEVNRERSYIGSEQNKLQFTMSNLSNNIQNIEASRSSIEDADFVVEATDLVKNQILAQSGTAMLAQASSISQDILSLIR
ncbi:hypothetical protein CMK22_20250, partial [Candidatus Poribacteria bacterium]|nr:hypothetical protein [Candidatus Poribacteria bacterium]